jgi:hypothetical protein
MPMDKVNIFIQHPREVNMTYLQHMLFALTLALTLLKSALASIIHAFFPFVFVSYSSSKIDMLHKLFQKRLQNNNHE